MYFLLKSHFVGLMEGISLVSACLALLGALYKRDDVAFSFGRKSIKAFVPLFMATSVWTVHYIILCRAMGQPYDSVGLLYPLGSYGFVVLGFYCALKVIDLGFSFSNYVSGAVIGGFMALEHVADKYTLAHSGAAKVAQEGLSMDSIVLALSFVMLWSSIVGYLTDYFKNREMITQLKTIAYTDTLTSLQNRNALNEHFADMLEKSGKNRQTFACMMIDLNKFKDINDTYGHLVGDEMLAMIGSRLKEGFEDKEHFVGRLGGDEFIVLAAYQNVAEVDALAETIYRLVVAPHCVGSVPLRVGCCIGISLFPHDGTTQKSLMGHADISLYEMKKNNCDGVCFYNGGSVRAAFTLGVPAAI
ncbi:GGDEF domain-containing protein [Acetobacter okinawensis]|uniref:GGDEF domain-containing protein n=1 Tax=Acetobacter okinawensis TaxID=1076594 RepID=UPI001BAC4FEE|nr:GGDEF domain-containing protein [Acetobacter okinawensis]MBS0966946.1 GGDEF domain-containing protein [Acetobacter okinawensis]